MKSMTGEAFIDSNLWLYAFVLSPGEETKHARASALIEASERYTISTQVVAEVSSNLLRKAGMAEEALLDIIVSFYSRCCVLETGLTVHQIASHIRATYHFSFWDSLIIAAALEAGCSILYSEDMQHGQVIDDQLTIMNPLLDPPG
jgi:predicted nucleic acid-binding protein